MFKYVTLNGEVYVKTEPTIWQKPITKASISAAIAAVLVFIYKKGRT